jgi:uracil-DNA glycosylase family 4
MNYQLPVDPLANITKCGRFTRCVNCPYGGRLVSTRGPVDSPFVIIGESPGKEEVKQGVPFVGMSRAVLDDALKQSNYPKDSYPEPYITNAFKCWPGTAKDQSSLVRATLACQDSTSAELLEHPRKVILALGNPAVWTTTQQYKSKITQVRGQLFKSKLASVGIVAATHPAFLLRGGGSYDQFKADVAYAIYLVRGGHPKFVPEVTFTVMDTPQKCLSFLAKANTQRPNYIGVDYETTGFNHIDDTLISAGYTLDGRHIYILPLLDHPELYPYLPKIHDIPTRWVWHNGKFDVKFAHVKRRLVYQADGGLTNLQPFVVNGLQQHFAGAPNARVDEDTMLASYSLNEIGGIHALEQVSSDILGSPDWKNEYKKYIPKGGTYADGPREMLYLYQAKDIANTYNLRKPLRERIDFDKYTKRQYERSLIPLSDFYTKVEENGMPIDQGAIEANDIRLRAEMIPYIEVINEASRQTIGSDINPNSFKQVGMLLYDVLKLKPLKGKPTTSTDAKALDNLPLHPVVVALKKYRKAQKAHGTYVKTLRDKLASDERLHATFKIHGSRTGRPSSDKPNVQNWPRDPRVRGMCGSTTHWIMECDLNQAELRCLAELSGDPTLVKIYSTQGMSLHDEVRIDTFGNPKDWSPQDVERYMLKFKLQERYDAKTGGDLLVHEQKMKAKNINFGIPYGISSHGLADQADVSVSDAQAWLVRWNKKFPIAREFIDKCRFASIRGQTLVTVFGYKKRFGVVTPETITNIMNESANFPHQSIAALMTAHAGINTVDLLQSRGVRIISTIHDSLLLELPKIPSLARWAAKLVCHELETVPIKWGLTAIPFVADAKLGSQWGSGMDVEKYINLESGRRNIPGYIHEAYHRTPWSYQPENKDRQPSF